jgi:ferric-dicitrate binding protein FerR (iron transport regulator)
MTSKENKGLDQWLSAHASQPEADGALKKLWDLTGSYKNNYEPDIDKGLAAFQQRLAQVPGTQAKVVRMKPAAKLLRIAAAVMALLVAGFAVKNFLLNPASNTETLATAANSIKNIPLSDGTVVTLNQNGSLEFPENFTGDERRVRLEGEAFFEVAHNPAKPFVLETGPIEVKVLGTSFNVRSFPNEPAVQVFVKTGKVQVKLMGSGKTYNLTPGDMLVFPKKEKTASVAPAPSGNAVGWKEGKLRFKETPLKEILAQVQQQFGVAFDLAGASKLDCPFTISIEQKNLKDAFQALAASCPLEFVQDGENKIRVSGRCCE